MPELLLHVSRRVRWDSEHVVTLTDELQAIMQEEAKIGFIREIRRKFLIKHTTTLEREIT